MKLLGWVPDSIWLVSLQEEEGAAETCVHRKGRGRTQRGGGRAQPRTEVSGESSHADAFVSNSQPPELRGNKSQLFEPRAGRCSVRQLERTHQGILGSSVLVRLPRRASWVARTVTHDIRPGHSPSGCRLSWTLRPVWCLSVFTLARTPTSRLRQPPWAFCFSLCVYTYTLSTSFYPTMSHISYLSTNRPHSSARSLVHTPRQVWKRAFQMMKGTRLGQTRNIYSCWWNSVPSHSIWNFKQVESPDVAWLQPVPGYSIYFYFYIKKNQRATYIQTIE